MLNDDDRLQASLSSPLRWCKLFSFCLFSFSNAMGFVQFAPIPAQGAEYYKVSQSMVLQNSNMYYACFAVFGALGLYPFVKKMDTCIIIGSLMNMTGGWIKFLGGPSMYAYFIGFFLIGTSQIFLLNAPVYIVDKWFSVNERNLATALASFVNGLGINFGFMMAVLLVGNDANKIPDLNLYFALIQSAAFLGCLLFVRNPPPESSLSILEDKLNIMDSVRIICRDGRNIFDIISMSVGLGVNWTIISVISILLQPYGYSQMEIGIIGLWFSLSGALVGLFATIYLDWQILQGSQPSYDRLIKVFLIMAMVGMIALSFLVECNKLWLTSLLTAIVGIGLNAYFPIASQSMVEKLFPANELVVMTAFMLSANVALQFILVLIRFLLQQETSLFQSHVQIMFNQQLVLEIFGMWILCGITAPFVFFIVKMYVTHFYRAQKEKELSTKRSTQFD